MQDGSVPSALKRGGDVPFDLLAGLAGSAVVCRVLHVYDGDAVFGIDPEVRAVRAAPAEHPDSQSLGVVRTDHDTKPTNLHC